MRSLIAPVMALLLFAGAHAACAGGQWLFDWTGVPEAATSQWTGMNEFGEVSYPHAYINHTYITVDRDYLYMRFDFWKNIYVGENMNYVTELHINRNDINYYKFTVGCDGVTELLRKPNNFAAINMTASPDWNSTRNNFTVSFHGNTLEVKVLLSLVKNPYETAVYMKMYWGSGEVNDLNVQWPFSLCPTTGVVCGNGACEDWEDYALHPCVCPSDCPGMDTSCIGTMCGNGWCETGEKTIGSLCECPADCPAMVSSNQPCAVGEPVTDWSGASELATRSETGQNQNGTGLMALRSKVDKDNFYVRVVLNPDETPHENITYNMKIYPQVGGVEYIIFKLDCSGLYEMLEKVSGSPSATNYTSRPDWASIRENFTFSTTENAVEMRIPWYAIYKPSGFYFEARSYVGSSEINFISASLQDMSSLFVNTCGDGTCIAQENDSYNRYQFCPQDCPDAPETLLNNGFCDEGEGDRWGPVQWVWDCQSAFSYLNIGGGQIDIYNDVSGREDGSATDNIIGPIIVISVIIIVVTGAYRGVKKLFSKATSGIRKKSDLKERKVEISKEREDLQQKFLETRVSEEQFRKQMTELDREEQNIDLELKK